MVNNNGIYARTAAEKKNLDLILGYQRKHPEVKYFLSGASDNFDGYFIKNGSMRKYIITGKHSLYMDTLEKHHAFDYHWQIYVVAPLIGFMYKRKAEPDNNSEINPSKIMMNQLMERQEQIYFNYRLIMLKDEQHEPDIK